MTVADRKTGPVRQTSGPTDGYAAESVPPGGDQQSVIRGLQSGLRTVPRNSPILREEGDAHLQTIVSGWAFRCLHFQDGRRHILDILLPGDTFGIESLFGQPSAAVIWAATAVTYSVTDPIATMALFDSEPWFRRRLMQAVLERNAALEEWLAHLGRCDAEERTAALFVVLHERLLKRGLATERSFILELTQQELADVLGIHLIHVNRIMARLRGRMLINTSGQEVTLTDYQGLTDLIPIPTEASRHLRPL